MGPESAGLCGLVTFFLIPPAGQQVSYQMKPTTKVREILELSGAACLGPRRKATLMKGNISLDPEATLAQLGLERDTTLRVKVTGLQGGTSERTSSREDTLVVQEVAGEGAGSSSSGY